MITNDIDRDLDKRLINIEKSISRFENRFDNVDRQFRDIKWEIDTKMYGIFLFTIGSFILIFLSFLHSFKVS